MFPEMGTVLARESRARRSRTVVPTTLAYDPSLSELRFSPNALALRPCVLVRTHSGNRNGLVSLLWSLLLSGHPRLQAFVVDTGVVSAPGLQGIADSVNALSGREWVHVSDWTHARNVRAPFPNLRVQDFGYILTDLVMEDIMNGRVDRRRVAYALPTQTPDEASPPSPACNTLTVTNADNVYSPDFLVRTLDLIAQGKDMVGTNWVSHYDKTNPWPAATPAPYASDWCGPYRGGKNQEMKASPGFECNCIDLGAVVFRLAPVLESGTRFIVDKLRNNATLHNLPYSDCLFFKRIKKLGGETGIVHEALFIHN